MLIQLQQVTKRFDRRTVLDDITITFRDKDVVLLTGANGSGKTTFLRLVAGVLKPTSGKVLFSGPNLTHLSKHQDKRVGLLNHETMLYGDLSATQNLRFWGCMYGVQDLNSRIEMMLHHVGLHSRRDDVVRTFSRGMMQRLAVARALLHDPAVLLLDEPFTGLDQEASSALSALISMWMEERNPNGHVLIIASHLPAIAGIVCNRKVQLKGGKVTGDVSPIPQSEGAC